MNEKLSTVCEHKEMMTDDVIAAIVRLRQTHENLLIEADRINRAIDDLKRVREMARAIGNQETGMYADHVSGRPDDK